MRAFFMPLLEVNKKNFAFYVTFNNQSKLKNATTQKKCFN